MFSRIRLSTFLGIFCGVLLALVSIAAYLWFDAQSLLDGLSNGKKKAVVAAVLPQLKKAPAHPAFGDIAPNDSTFLLVGTDSRDPTSSFGNTDTMILIRLNSKNKYISMLSIPRDLQVEIPGHGPDKINAAYSLGGMPLLIQTLRDWLGVKIDHFALINFSGFAKIINRLGGIYLPIERRYYHQNNGTIAEDYSNIDLLPGYQRLSGLQALSWVRYRHTDSDIYRTARQQIFLTALRREITSQASDDLLPVIKLGVQASISDLTSLPQLLGLAQFLRDLPSGRIYRQTLSGTPATIDGIDYLLITPAQVKTAIHSWLFPPTRALRLNLNTLKPSPTKRKSRPTPAALSSDLLDTSGSAQSLIGSTPVGFDYCVPQYSAPGYSYLAGVSGIRRYQLNNYPALAIVADDGFSGTDYLWMQSTWPSPPILSDPSLVEHSPSGTLQLYQENGRLRQIALEHQGTWLWLTNTLTDNLTNQQMQQMISSCKWRY